MTPIRLGDIIRHKEHSARAVILELLPGGNVSVSLLDDSANGYQSGDNAIWLLENVIND